MSVQAASAAAWSGAWPFLPTCALSTHARLLLSHDLRSPYIDTGVVGPQQLQDVPAGVGFSRELQDIVHWSTTLASNLSISAAGPTACYTVGSIDMQAPLRAAAPCIYISNSSNLASTNATRNGSLAFSYIPLTLVPQRRIIDPSSASMAPQRLDHAAGGDDMTSSPVPTTPTGQRLGRPAVPPAVKPTKPLFRCQVDGARANCSQTADLPMRQQQLQRVQDWLAATHC